MRELDYKEGWVPKNWCFWTVVLEKTLESSLNYKELKLANPKENQSWMFIGRTGAEAETPVLWLPDVKSWLIGKDSDARKDWRQEGKGTTDDEMVGWHHWLDGHEFEQAPGDGERQGSLEQCSPWGHKESSMTERLNWFSYRISRLINMWPRPTVALVIIFYKLYTTFQCNPLPWGYLVKDIYIYNVMYLRALL